MSESPMEMSPIIRPVRRPLVFNRENNNHAPDATITTKNRQEEETCSNTDSTDSQETYFSQADLFSSYQELSQDKNAIEKDDSPIYSNIDGAYQQARDDASSQLSNITKQSSHDIIVEVESEVQSLTSLVVMNGEIWSNELIEETAAKILSVMTRIQILNCNVSRSEKKRLEHLNTSCEVLQQQLSSYSVPKTHNDMLLSQHTKAVNRSIDKEKAKVHGISKVQVDLPDLKTLLDFKLISSGRTCLILRTSECSQTYGFLNKDGSVVDVADGMVYKDIETWFGSKKEGPVTRNEAYLNTFYRQKSLLSICAKHCNFTQKSGNAHLDQAQVLKSRLLPEEQLHRRGTSSQLFTSNQQLNLKNSLNEVNAESQLSDSQIQKMIKFSQPDIMQSNSSFFSLGTNESIDESLTPGELQFTQGREVDWDTIAIGQRQILKSWERILSGTEYREAIIEYIPK